MIYNSRWQQAFYCITLNNSHYTSSKYDGNTKLSTSLYYAREWSFDTIATIHLVNMTGIQSFLLVCTTQESGPLIQ